MYTLNVLLPLSHKFQVGKLLLRQSVMKDGLQDDIM